MTVMMFETTVYLAYYKDVIFASVTLLNYVGMFLNNHEDHTPVRDLEIAFISITSVFILVTILHDFDKAFYRQYSKFYSKYQVNRAKLIE